jgi:hypothetical protein
MAKYLLLLLALAFGKVIVNQDIGLIRTTSQERFSLNLDSFFGGNNLKYVIENPPDWGEGNLSIDEAYSIELTQEALRENAISPQSYNNMLEKFQYLDREFFFNTFGATI